MKNTSTRFSIIALCSMLATLPACEIEFLGIGGELPLSTQSQLDINRKKWESEMVSSYNFSFQWSCFCLPDYVAQVNITVRENRIHGAAFVEGDIPIPLEVAKERYRTMEGLFNLLQSAIDENAETISVTYHPELGYPTEVWIDYDERIADEERGFTIHSLSVEQS